MKSDDALLVAWDETHARLQAAPAILDTRGEALRTFREINERAREFERKIDIFDPGSVVAVQIGNHEEWPSILIACLRKRLVVLPLEQSMAEQQRDAALDICNAAGVVAAAVSGGRDIELLPMRTRLRRATAQRASAATTDWDKNQPALLKLTSGTTAEPRAVRFRSEQLLADCEQICETMGIEDVDLNFGAIPISHSYGFSNLLTPLLARGVPMVLSHDRTPRALIVDLARTNATVFPGMPVFYQALAEIENVPSLQKLRLCISAGAPLPVSAARKFRQKFNLPVHSFYGASECGGICYDRAGRNEIEGFVGQPMKNVDLALVDANAEVTQVRVRSAAVGDGYFPEPDAEKLGNGFFLPDDLLTKTTAGFQLVGRVSDIINVAGKKVHPAEVEAQLRRFAGVREAVVFGRESMLRHEEVAACVVAGSNVDENELLEFCRRGLSGWQVPRRIFIVDEIPVNERGKISRRELARRFAL
jgi:long-chain acyl-CoA synthetase